MEIFTFFVNLEYLCKFLLFHWTDATDNSEYKLKISVLFLKEAIPKKQIVKIVSKILKKTITFFGHILKTVCVVYNIMPI